MPKLDIIGIPNFLAGAMENWGIVTFREEYLLLFKNNDNFNKLKILEVIYHELAHQWFGNLVTLDKWDNLWLNEANATYFSWIALEDNYKDLLIPEFYYLLECKNLLKIDGLKNTHSIIPSTELDINPVSLFDEITYGKGSYLINYISKLMGKDKFKKSINLYLKENMYLNCDSSKLYKCFNIIDNTIDYEKLINNLVKEVVYPILYIYNKNNNIIIKKKKFNLDKNEINEYNVDIYIKFNNKILLLNKEINSINANINKFYINNDFLCIVNYVDIKPNINLMTQCGLIKYLNDELILGLYGHNSLKEYFNLLDKYFKNINFHKNQLLLYDILYELNKILLIYKLSGIKNNINKHIQNNYVKIIIKILKEYIINSKIIYFEKIIDQILILLVINLNIKYIRDLSIKIFNEQINSLNNNKIILCKSLFSIISKHCLNESNLKFFYKNLNNNYLINDIIESFQYFNELEIDKILLNFKSNIKSQDYSLFFSTLSKNKYYQKKILNYFFDNINNITSNKDHQLKILENIVVNIFNIELIKLITEWITKNNKNNTHDIIFNKINDILKTNLIIYNNLLGI